MHPAKARELRSVARAMAVQLDILGLDRGCWAEKIEAGMVVVDPGPGYPEFRAEVRALVEGVVSGYGESIRGGR